MTVLEQEFIFERKIGEDYRTYKARVRKAHNAAVDALNLQPGDPISYDGTFTRFGPRYADRRLEGYSTIRRLHPFEIKRLEREEEERRDREARSQAIRAENDAFNTRPEVRAANNIRFMIENDLERVLYRLTPQEWVELSERLEPMEGA